MDLNETIQANMGLVYKQLHKFNRVHDDEAYSKALIALGKAAETYDKDKGYTFSTYASVCIYNAIAHHLRDEARENRLPVVSYDDYVEGTEDLTFAEMIAAPDTAESEYLRKELFEKIWEAFDTVYETLPNDTAKRVISLWRESEFTSTQGKIASLTGLSQSYVSRILSAFKHKLKKELEDYLCGQ